MLKPSGFSPVFQVSAVEGLGREIFECAITESELQDGLEDKE